MKTLSAATAIALALTAGAAFAADLPSSKAPPVYLPPAPVFTWTGFYGGVNVGYGWNESASLSGANIPVVAGFANIWSSNNGNVDGVLGGGQIGYNYQFAGTGFVVGLEADIQAADLTGTHNAAGLGNILGWTSFVATRHSLDWFGTVRGRIGYAILPELLVYGTGGFAYGEGSSRFTYGDTLGFFSIASESSTRTGWTAGGGIEWAFLPNWSAKVEYLYVDLGRSNDLVGPAFGPVAGIVSQTGVQNRFHTVRVGLNYHVNLFGDPAPVVAKY
jgi:outer membrane immunogenic protein